MRDLVRGLAHDSTNNSHTLGRSIQTQQRGWDDLGKILDELETEHPGLRVGSRSYRKLREQQPRLLDHGDESLESCFGQLQTLKRFARLDVDPGTPLVVFEETAKDAVPTFSMDPPTRALRSSALRSLGQHTTLMTSSGRKLWEDLHEEENEIRGSMARTGSRGIAETCQVRKVRTKRAPRAGY